MNIFCTLGPTSLNKNFLSFLEKKKYIVSLVRINLSHINIEDVKQLSVSTSLSCASAWADLPGISVADSPCRRPQLAEVGKPVSSRSPHGSVRLHDCGDVRRRGFRH